MPTWKLVQHHPPPSVTTLVDLLAHRVAARPDLEVYRYLVDGEEQAETLTLAELDRRSRAVAARLQQAVRPGDRVLMLYPPGNEFAVGLFGCLLAGAIAVPAPDPEPGKAGRMMARIEAIAADAQVAAAITTAAVERPGSAALAEVPWIATDEIDPALAERYAPPEGIRPETPAWLQYTSGSTASPRGVVVTHANALVNCADFNDAYDLTPDSVMVSWVPAHHDLGLINAVVLPVFVGFRCVSMAPMAFVQRPVRWLQAVSRYRGTHTICPNFGFDLAVVRTRPSDRAGLDLSSWKHALNGAEPVRRESEARFVEAMAPHGFDPGTISHAYGMSEATAKISAEPPGRRSVFATLDAAALEQNRVQDAAPGARAIVVAGNGVPAGDMRVAIVDPDTGEALGEDRIGEIWLSGSSVGGGYWGKPEATEATFGARIAGDPARWLRTGDMGFLRGGEVFITGRRKDMIIVRGENHYPQDLEWSVDGCHPAVRPNAQVAFSVEHDGAESVAVVTEVYPDRVDDPQAVFGAMRAALEPHGLSPAALALVIPGGVPKTSSGKVQRQLARRDFLRGELPVVARFDSAATDRSALDGVDLAAVVRAAPPPHRAGILLLHARHLVAGLLGIGPAEVEPDRPLQELGLDSINQIEMVEQLGARLGIDLPGSTVRDFPTLDGVVREAVARLE